MNNFEKIIVKRCMLYFFLVIISVIVLCGCAVSSNFYSGRTLEEKKFAVIVGADDIFLKSTYKSVEISKGAAFEPSVGFQYGLPSRFEVGLRYYPTTFLEGSLRHQLNPRAFDLFDCSLNLHYGHFFNSDSYSYIRYGISISKNFNGFEPYANYSLSRFVGVTEGDFSNSFISNAASDLLNHNRVVGFGIGIPFRKVKFFPEADYQYYGNNLSQGLWHFGLGLRIGGN